MVTHHFLANTDEEVCGVRKLLLQKEQNTGVRKVSAIVNMDLVDFLK